LELTSGCWWVENGRGRERDREGLGARPSTRFSSMRSTVLLLPGRGRSCGCCYDA
jgi:hypothetical protein